MQARCQFGQNGPRIEKSLVFNAYFKIWSENVRNVMFLTVDKRQDFVTFVTPVAKTEHR